MHVSQTIQDKLRQLEVEKSIRILYACETGSRAWGFPSPDSDYDVRFLYTHSRDWYLRLGEGRDSIECMDGELDITGWDIRKSLRLLHKSNVAMLERFSSPIVYVEFEGFADGLRILLPQYFSPVAVFYHHHSLANKFWKEMEGVEDVKLKSYFYLVRSLLSCHWVVERKVPPPIQLDALLEAGPVDWKQVLLPLTELKTTKLESYRHSFSPDMRRVVDELQVSAKRGETGLNAPNKDWKDLDTFFLKWIQ